MRNRIQPLARDPKASRSSHNIVADASCCWPTCDAPSTPRADVPLCGEHLIQAWRAADLGFEEYVRGRSFLTTLPQYVPRPTDGVVYFIRFRDSVKIGFSINFAKRVLAHPCDEILGTIPGTMNADIRIHGEWFHATPDLLDWVAGVVEGRIVA
jgi:hypothetical protein